MPGMIIHVLDPALANKSRCSIRATGDGCHDNGSFTLECQIWAADSPIPPDTKAWATWMPYQMGQAAKTKELESQAAKTAKHAGSHPRK